MPPINATKDMEEDLLRANRMLELVLNLNALKVYVEENNLREAKCNMGKRL